MALKQVRRSESEIGEHDLALFDAVFERLVDLGVETVGRFVQSADAVMPVGEFVPGTRLEIDPAGQNRNQQTDCDENELVGQAYPPYSGKSWFAQLPT